MTEKRYGSSGIGKIVKAGILIFACMAMIAVLLYQKGIFRIFDRLPEISGQGTAADPYRITSAEDLAEFRDFVNAGNTFADKYFLQTENIDLDNIEWIPIGIFDSGKYFSGVYDGGGHYIEKLTISAQYPFSPANTGMFGTLSGTVKNLGIESGRIEGDYCGSFASHAYGNAQIINCYNKADIYGIDRAGGICDNFGGGFIINCVNAGNVTAPTAGAITSYTAGFVSAVYPIERLPDTFTGEYKKIGLEGGNVKDLLNSGLDKLVQDSVIRKSDVIWWR